MGHCTMPRAFGIRKWLEARFDDIFAQHDINYANADISRFKADCYLASALMASGWPYLSIVVFTAVRLFGARHYNENRKRRCVLCQKKQKLVGANKPYQRWVDE